MTQTYTPSSGLAGKARRLAARAFARRTLDVDVRAPLVSFSFDDFPRSAMGNALPELDRRGWKATWYAAGGFEGRANHLGEMFIADDLIRLEAEGHEIGCHTHTHGDASRISADETARDCRLNWQTLAGMGLGSAPESFAFPYGEASPPAKRRLEGCYRALRGVRPGVNCKGADLNLLNAVSLDGGAAGLDRALGWVEAVKRRPGWLIFFGHDVSDAPSEWGCTPAFFKTVCEAVERSGAEVLPVARALDRIEEMDL